MFKFNLSIKSLNQKGQILLETLMFLAFLFSFLIAIEFFQNLARKEIQKERLTKQKILKKNQVPWVR